MNKLSTIKDRSLEIADYYGVSKEKFCAGIGMSYASFKGSARSRPLNSDAVDNILTSYPEVSAKWLVTGKGEMLSHETEKPKKKAYEIKESELTTVNERPVPLVSNEAAAGFGTDSSSIREQDILERYLVPDFHNVDFMLRITGNSMSPTYQSGDIIACRSITDRQFIQWGHVYLIASRSQGILVKRINPGQDDDHFECVSDNADFAPFQFPVNDLESIGLIVGTIRLE